MKTFATPNGRQVSEIITDSGVTGVIDTSIPTAALNGWREQLLRRMASNARAQGVEDIDELTRLNRD